MLKLNLTNLFTWQKELDKKIHIEHKVNYKKIVKDLKLALLVELSELANEIRSFKFWSYKKASPKNVILEEYVDGIHFITSLCIFYKVPSQFSIVWPQTKFKSKQEITNELLKLFELAKTLLNSKITLQNWYQKYLIFGFKLGFNQKEIIDAYNKNGLINFKRQTQKY